MDNDDTDSSKKLNEEVQTTPDNKVDSQKKSVTISFNKKTIFSILIILAIIIVSVVGTLIATSDDSTKKTIKPKAEAKAKSKTFKFTLWIMPSTPTDFTVASKEACDGSDVSIGFYDINSLSQVIVRNAITEKIIKRFSLGEGESIGGAWCSFSTDFELTEGSDNGQDFTFEVNDADRGTLLITWEKLVEDEKVLLTLGGSE